MAREGLMDDCGYNVNFDCEAEPIFFNYDAEEEIYFEPETYAEIEGKHYIYREEQNAYYEVVPE